MEVLKGRDLFKERNKIIKNILKPIFKKAGFKVSGSTLRRETDDLYQRLTIQNSQWNHNDSVSFYINIDSESKFYYKFKGEELPISDSTWNFRAYNVIGGEESYTLDYKTSFEDFQKKIEEDMNLLIKRFFDLSSFDLYMFNFKKSGGVWKDLMYLLVPVLKNNIDEGSKRFNDFLNEIKKSSDVEYVEETEKEIKRVIDIIKNNKEITPPEKVKHNILYLNSPGGGKNNLKKRKFRDVFPMIIDWLEENTNYSINSEIKFSLNKYYNVYNSEKEEFIRKPSEYYTKEVDIIVKAFMEENFQHLHYEVGDEINISINDVNKLNRLSKDKKYLDFFKYSKYNIELEFIFNLKGIKEIDSKIMKKNYFRTKIKLNLSEYCDSSYYINIKEGKTSSIIKKDINDFVDKFLNNFPYKFTEDNFSIKTIEIEK